MSFPGPASDRHAAWLYDRIFYDTELEAVAFENLAARDIPACRRAFDTLLGRLDLSHADEHQRLVIQLFADVLHRVNRRVHPRPEREAAYQRNRLALIESFSSCDDLATARERFRFSLESLLRPTDRDDRLHPTIERAKAYIQEHFHRRIYLSSIAKAIAVSPNYLSRLFRRETGITLTTYVQRVRLNHAMRLLENGRYSLSEIAYRVGYQNYRDFYRNFVKHVGASPRDVRQRVTRGRDARVPSRRGTAVAE